MSATAQMSRCEKIVYSWGRDEKTPKGVKPNRLQRRLQKKHKVALKCAREWGHEGDCMPLGEIYRRLGEGERIKGWELTPEAVLAKRGIFTGVWELLYSAPGRIWRWLTENWEDRNNLR